jgi:flagellin-like hook-associated protein FlgL
VTTRITELAEQSANGSYSNEQRVALQAEADALVAEFNRIAASTKFNDRQLFSGDTEFRIQDGYGVDGGIQVDFESLPKLGIGDGTFSTASNLTIGVASQLGALSGDLNQDGITDLVTLGFAGVSAQIGNGDGSFTEVQTFDDGNQRNGTLGDLNGDGVVDLIYNEGNNGDIFVRLSNGDGTFQAGTSYSGGPFDFGSAHSSEVFVGDVNNDGVNDVIALQADSNFGLYLGNGDGTLQARQVQSSLLDGEFGILEDFNGDGNLDLTIHSNTTGETVVKLGNGSGSFSTSATIAHAAGAKQSTAGDFNGDGFLDIASISTSLSLSYGNGDGTFQSAQTIALPGALSPNIVAATDLNRDGYTDFIGAGIFGAAGVVGLNNGDGTFTFSQTMLTAGTVAVNQLLIDDLNDDGILDLAAAAAGGVELYFGNGTASAGIEPVTISTQLEAREALGSIEEILDKLNTTTGNIGASQSRLQAALQARTATVDTLKEASARITDIDVARESAEMVRLQIVQQAASAVLTNANQSTRLALNLLNPR